MTVPPLAQETVSNLKEFLPSVAILNNPVDIISSANKECYRKTTEIVSSDPNIDAVIVNCVVPTFLDMKPSEHAEGTVEAYQSRIKDSGKPIVCCWMAGELADPGRTILENAGVPTYTSPEKAALAISSLASYYEFRNRSLPRKGKRTA